MRLSMHIFAVAAVAVGLHAGLMAAQAQTQQPAKPPTATAPAAPIPDKKLDAAAVAIIRVASLQQDYQKRVETAPDADKQRVLAEGQQALVKAVTDQGLTVDEYSSIIDTAKSDPQRCARKLMQRLPPSGQPGGRRRGRGAQRNKRLISPTPSGRALGAPKDKLRGGGWQRTRFARPSVFSTLDAKHRALAKRRDGWGPFPETHPTRPLGFANRPLSPAEFILGRAEGATRGHGRDRRLS